MKTFLLLLLLFVSLYGKDEEIVCFENPFMVVNSGISIENIMIYLSDVNRSREEGGRVTRMYYTLKNGHTYHVNFLLLSYNKETQSYVGGVECDGGWMEYDSKHNVMYMEDIRGVDERGFGFKISDEMVRDGYIETFNNPETGWLNTVVGQEKRDSSEKVWVYGKKCNDIKEPKHKIIYYTTKAYREAFPNKKDRDSYFKRFYEPLIKREEEDGKIEHIKLKKSYRSIAKMMEYEGFDSDWITVEDIELFVHDNRRAFIRFSPYIPKDTSGCFCGGYKLLEMNGDDLTILSFGWECGSVVAPFVSEIEFVEIKI